MHISPGLSGRLLLLLLSFLIFFPVTSLQGAAVPSENKIPRELQQWIPWVLYEQEEKLCSLNTTEGSRRYCTWPSSLTIDVKADGARFTQDWLIETRSLVPLPGNSPFWPMDVQANGKALPVSKHQGHPAVWLNPGKHRITGTFSWTSLPESIFVPPETGLIQLTLLNKKTQNLQLDQQGRLWFRQKKQTQNDTEESLSVQVFRKITDGVPLTQQLNIQLIVSGSPRQITLGLESGTTFTPLFLHSPLPVRLDNRGRLQLQVRPGQWQIQLTLRNTEALSPKTLAIGTLDGPWPTEEIWVFAADPKLRQIEISGVAAVNPSRTSLPEEWKNFPAYQIQSNEEMTLIEKNRGNPNPAPNRLKLKRRIWLDEQGSGLTVYDTISGTMTRDWRLNVNPSQSLGKVDVEGNSRLITKLKGSERIGVEVRQGQLALHAESRINRAVKNGQLEIPTLGWDHKVQQLSAELNLPPGWKLLTASGVDRVSTWLNHWTLLDIFLVLIIGLATAKILGLGWGSLAILFLFLSYHQPGSPRYLWLPLLGLLAMQKVITATPRERLCRIGGLSILVVIIVGSVPFMIHEIRVGIYPQLEFGNYRRITQGFDMEQSVPMKQRTPMADKVALEESANRSQGRATVSGVGHYSLTEKQTQTRLKSIQIDPQDMIQTGPGLPDWDWNRIHLSWNGPVNPEQNISFIFLSPRAHMVLAFMRVLFLTVLIGGFLRQCVVLGKHQTGAVTSKALGLLIFFLLPIAFHGQDVRAEVPSPEILQELQNRLLAPPECAGQCAIINTCMIRVDNDILQLELQIDSLIRGAVLLPGKNRLFDEILLNNQAADILRQDSRGDSLIRLEPGSHTVLLKKQLTGQNKISFSFPLLPEKAQALLNNWSINGLHEDGHLDKQISLTRMTPAAVKEQSREEEGNTVHIPAFVRVERTLHMGLKWNVTTRIIRLSPGTIIAMDIPLLPGEHVTTDGLHLKDRRVRINMGPKQRLFSYHSAIDPVDTLQFTAQETSSWTEVWLFDVSPIWHVEAQGLPEVNQTNPAGMRYPEYHPYPGESLQLFISRPQGVPGPVMTITRSKRVIKPGLRATETTLFFSLIASRGLQHSIILPADIDLQKSLINGEEFPLQLENNRLVIPLRPGKQDVEIGFRSERGIVTKLISEPIDIGIESVNASIEMTVPSSRWIVLTGGPRVGPAVLFWGEMLVIILFALLLGRIKLTPLSTLQWLLLSLGLSQIPAPLAAVVVAWLLLLGLRKKRGHEIRNVSSFNLVQVFLVLLTLAALAALFFAIQQGLLGHPDMQIGGNGSNGHSLRWYQDRSDSLLPTAWVITIPLLAYRISMLLWALWLAIALLRWLRWGWECFSESTLWKKAPPKKKKVLKKRKVQTPPAKPVAKKQAATTGTVSKKVAPSQDTNFTKE